ncbi:hypothetical protein [Neolewinella litorea]|uniref:Uncharacterized protein n=1 Tax=Neolewinella litorea TaxID=2562452 RepID=A0A4S4NH55_9BACT|nr:hypothetical protein [Neolewinella litorea]THH37511.1 hypothetical protein E4021_13895 [Neolewinella litorea]
MRGRWSSSPSRGGRGLLELEDLPVEELESILPGDTTGDTLLLPVTNRKVENNDNLKQHLPDL